LIEIDGLQHVQRIDTTVQDKILEGVILVNWQILPNSPKFSCSIKKIDFKKLSSREYSSIYYPPIIADSSFTKIFSLQNFVSYGIISLAS